MDANTAIEFNALHQAVLDAIEAQFPSLATVDDYPADANVRAPVALPAVLVELVDLERDNDGAPDPGTGQLAMVARFEARVIFGFRMTNAKREVRKLAAALAAFAHLNRWGLPVGPAEVIGCYPDAFSPELDRYEVWTVEWSQAVHLGTSAWEYEGDTPTEVLASWDPEVGIPHEDDYKPILDTEV